MRPSVLCLVASFACVGCVSEPPNPVKDAFTASQRTPEFGDAVAFRFSTRNRDRPVMYRLPTLERGQLRVEPPPHAVRGIVGFVADRSVIYAITDVDELAALDLLTGRFRVVDSSVAAGTVGPTGIPFVVHTDGTVATIGLKSVTPWPNGLTSLPSEIHGAVRERLIAVMVGDSVRRLVLVTNGQPTIEQSIPDGPLHVSSWGDAVVIATDSGLVLLDPAEPDDAAFLPIQPAPVDADFSASGHRIHIVREDGSLESVDRFSREPVDRVVIGWVPRAWRTDPWGRYLLLQGAAGSPIYIVDAVTLTIADSIDGEWDDQLPRATPDGSLLIRRGDAVITWVPDGPQPGGSVEAPEAVVWLTTAWDGTQPLAAVAEAAESEPTAPGQELFVQVSSTSNADWAADLATNLRRAGMPASVLDPATPVEPYRVVLGPYGTREEAEATGRQLRLPFWIFARDSTPTEP